MEIECQGCYYTLCSFVCLTEDLSEILQFLWRHGCLRRSYSCEKCGRKCAIGDKDLFFRCNRNTLETPLNSQQSNDSTGQSSNSHQILDCHQPQRNGDGQLSLHHQIDDIGQHRYMILHSNELSQQNRLVNLDTGDTANTDNLILLHRDNRLPHPAGLLQRNESCHPENVDLAVLNHAGLNHQNDCILTVINSHSDNQNSLISGNHSHNLQILQGQQDQTIVKQDGSETTAEEPPAAKVLKRTNKQEGVKIPKKRCNFKVSMKKGTFFEKSKLPIDTVCKFVVFWCCMKHPTQEFLRNELSLATRTVVDWSTACREICIHWAKSVSEKIGGDGVVVQVDEVKIQESKDHKQSDSHRFSFWGMEKDKEKGKIFIVPVHICDSWSLLTVVNDWILPGSVVISNCWKSYDCLKLAEFNQQTIVQSKTFVHPQNNAGQQNYDGKIDEAGASAGGEFQMPRFGTRRSHHLGDLAEFMFKRRYSNHLERMHAFFKQISLAYPLRW